PRPDAHVLVLRDDQFPLVLARASLYPDPDLVGVQPLRFDDESLRILGYDLEAGHVLTLPSPLQATQSLMRLVFASILFPEPEHTGQGIVAAGIRRILLGRGSGVK